MSNKEPETPPTPEESGPTALQWAIVVIVLGSSAGFTLYTKNSSSILQGMNQVTKNQMKRNPPKIGPPTKEEWEKMRPRFQKGDWF